MDNPMEQMEQTETTIVPGQPEPTERDTAIVDEKGVPWKNRAMEMERKLTEVKELSETRINELSQKIDSLGNKRSSEQELSEDELLQRIGERYKDADGIPLSAVQIRAINDSTAIIARKIESKFEERDAKRNIDYEKRQLGNDPYFVKYQKEIDKIIKSLPNEDRAKPGIVESTLQYVKGKHFDEEMTELNSKKGSMADGVDLGSTSNNSGKKNPLGRSLSEDEKMLYVNNSGLDEEGALRVLAIKERVMKKERKDKNNE